MALLEQGLRARRPPRGLPAERAAVLDRDARDLEGRRDHGLGQPDAARRASSTVLLDDSGAKCARHPRAAAGRRGRGRRARDRRSRSSSRPRSSTSSTASPSTARRLERTRDDGTLDLLELVEQHEGEKPTAGGPRSRDDVAFLTYTSGTTGPPKGAMNTHRNVVFNSQRLPRLVRDSATTTSILGVAPLFHITGLIAHVGVGLLTATPLILFYRFDPEVDARADRAPEGDVHGRRRSPSSSR